MVLPYAGHKKGRHKMAVDYKSIGSRIKYYRQQKNLSQEELGAAVQTARQHILKIENGDRSPSVEILILIANALEVSADDLLTDNLTTSHSSPRAEIFDILKDCNLDETKILIRTLEFLKALLAEFGV